MASGSASTKKKRKRVVLTIEEKVKVLDMLDKSVSYSITVACPGFEGGRC